MSSLVFAQKVGHSLELGDIILEVNDIAIRSAEDLQALVAMADKRIVFLVKKTPEQARDSSYSAVQFGYFDTINTNALAIVIVTEDC